MEPPRGARPQAGGYIKWAAGCAAEALPAAETAEAEQGQRSVFCEGAATPEAKAGHRNPGGLDNNNAGASLTADPRRGTLSFVTQKFFCFGAINNRRNYWLGISFLLSHRMGIYPSPQAVSSHSQAPYIKYSMVPCICYK